MRGRPPREYRIIHGIQCFECTGCITWKPAADFYRSNLTIDGLRSERKLCDNERRRHRSGHRFGKFLSSRSSHSLTAASTIAVSGGLSVCRSLNLSIRSTVEVFIRKFICCVFSMLLGFFAISGWKDTPEKSHDIAIYLDLFASTCNAIQRYTQMQVENTTLSVVCRGGVAFEMRTA